MRAEPRPLALRLHGGGDVATEGGGEDPDDKPQRGPPERHEPMSCTPDAEAMRARELADLVAGALALYARGRHPTPNLWTAAGNLRAWKTANGVVARCQKFRERETEPERVRARSRYVARAQDLLTIATEVYGVEETVEALIEQIVGNHPPASSDEDDDPDERWVGARACTHARAPPPPPPPPPPLLQTHRTPTPAPWPSPPAGVTHPISLPPPLPLSSHPPPPSSPSPEPQSGGPGAEQGAERDDDAGEA